MSSSTHLPPQSRPQPNRLKQGAETIHVGLAVDIGAQGQLAIEHFHRFVQPSSAQCQLCYVTPPQYSRDKVFELFDDEAKQYWFDKAQTGLKLYDDQLVARHYQVLEPIIVQEAPSVAEGLVGYVHTHHPDLLMMGMEPYKTETVRWQMDSSSYWVANHVSTPLLVVKRAPISDSVLRVLVALDGTFHDQEVFANLMGWLPKNQVVLNLVTVVSLHSYATPLAEAYVDYQAIESAYATHAQQYLEMLKQTFIGRGFKVDQTLVEYGDPADRLLTVSETVPTDLVVMGARDHSKPFSRWFMGSVSSKVLAHSHASVAVLHTETD